MPVDASIYANYKPLDVFGSIERGVESAGDYAKMKDLIHQYQKQQAVESAYANNTAADGSIDKQGVMSNLAKAGYGQEAFQAKNAIGAQEQQEQAKKYDLLQRQVNVVGPAMEGLSKLPADQRATLYPQIKQRFVQQGIINPKDSPDQYDDKWFNSWIGQYHQTKDYLDKRKELSEINKNDADAGMAPIKKNAELYGSRSPNAELTSQYNNDVKTIRQSQGAMNQMIDNYKNPSPQGDASLILNAFKIKFPNAPDVNSLEELSKSQAASDQFKQMAAHALQGGLDQGTRDNLMRDAVSTYRANYDTYQGIKDRYQARQKVQNVNDPTLTYEPAIDKTYGTAMDLQKNIGPYVPPSDRGGTMAAITKAASRLLQGKGKSTDSNNDGSAYAASPKSLMTSQDAEALHWLDRNPNDPHAADVRAKLQGKGLVK